jgi:ABC-2 type transport system ATP-binding protein
MTDILPIHISGTDLAVETLGLVKRYRQHTALDEVSLQVPTGAVYLLVGPNGAGKSTILKTLLNLVRPDAGQASVFSLDTRRSGPSVRAKIGYVPEQGEWGYTTMRAGRLLQHHSQYFPTWDPAYAEWLSQKFKLRLDQRMRELSKGQARRVHLVMALAHRPPLLLLDEPTDGLDPVMRDEMIGILSEHLAETPTTVLVSTHHVEEVERFADHIGVLSEGKLRTQMSLDDLRKGLRRYRVDVPDDWRGAPELNGAVIRRVDTPREVQWTVWGSESDVVAQFANANATVRDVVPVSLLDASVALLTSNAA